MDVDSPNSLKRCSSAPHINNLLPTAAVGVPLVMPMDEGQSQQETPLEPIGLAQQQPPVCQSSSTISQHPPHSPQLQLMATTTISNSQTAGTSVHRYSRKWTFELFNSMFYFYKFFVFLLGMLRLLRSRTFSLHEHGGFRQVSVRWLLFLTAVQALVDPAVALRAHA